MAVAPTGAIYKALTFDGISSRNYGVYITGEAVYNAPARDVEMITIPGRNGTFALDNGRFENIEVTYPAGIFADTEADYRQAISDFRNFLCSRKGYVRLTDEYNPDEYRMAVYKSGLDVTPAQLKAGEFDITFDCKPQRWLTSGETETTVTSGGTLTNPTLFESGPLLAVEGYGSINFNGYRIELDNSTSVPVLLKSGQSDISVSGSLYSIQFIESMLTAGDAITLGASSYMWKPVISGGTITGNFTIDSNSGISGSDARARSGGIIIDIPALSFVKGTALSYTNITEFHGSRSTGGTFTAQYTLDIAYDGVDTITFSFTDTYSQTWITRDKITIYEYGDVTGIATQELLGHPTYIDCELGDAYKIVDGEYVSLNGNVGLGSDLPKLAPGSNTVTFDNTVTELKITPRWWKI